MIQQEGDGWRFAHDPARGHFCILIGGDRWAFELTFEEWRGLIDVVIALIDQHRALVDQLMEEEALTIELERGPWWVALDGNQQEWGLALVLNAAEGRSAEGAWAAPEAMALVAAMRTELDQLE